ncbi:hypothetical protein M1B72_16425 [Geomonas paludis]|uniref:Uncharacterized protein n=1 Tax=Geomonas paludis TaxID=2740185 RepID=A0ABY4LE26_9BACT|nr:hypothetical protein [Geomonas paludis]UPU35023.1 hypothetical protein M1B72_16425 [Geomonas paludis]
MSTSYGNTATVLSQFEDDVFETFSLDSTFFTNPKDVVDALESPRKSTSNTEADKMDVGNKVKDLFFYQKQNYVRETPFVSLQKWEGVVTDVTEKTFVAKLVDLKTEDDEFAEIPKDEVTEEDLLLLRRGAIFYWNIGYSYTSGTKTRASLVRFKRMPRLTKKEEDAAQERALKLWDKVERGDGVEI